MAIKRKINAVGPDEVELNRWCIEMAMRWPVVSMGGGGNYTSGMGMARQDCDADVIGRAGKILAWVNARH